MSNNIPRLIVLGGSLFVAARCLSDGNTLNFHMKEPFTVTRHNYIIFSDLTIKKDEKDFYYCRHVTPLSVYINQVRY